MGDPDEEIEVGDGYYRIQLRACPHCLLMLPHRHINSDEDDDDL